MEDSKTKSMLTGTEDRIGSTAQIILTHSHKPEII